MINEIGVSSHKGKYSCHFLVNISRDSELLSFLVRDVFVLKYKLILVFTVMQLLFFEK